MALELGVAMITTYLPFSHFQGERGGGVRKKRMEMEVEVRVDGKERKALWRSVRLIWG
jgi:hypothetical protein